MSEWPITCHSTQRNSLLRLMKHGTLLVFFSELLTSDSFVYVDLFLHVNIINIIKKYQCQIRATENLSTKCRNILLVFNSEYRKIKRFEKSKLFLFLLRRPNFETSTSNRLLLKVSRSTVTKLRHYKVHYYSRSVWIYNTSGEKL